MDYSKKSKAALIEEIKALKRLNDVLIKEQIDETRLSFGWAGNLGHWYWDYPTNHVTFNPLKVEALGYKLEDIPSPVPYDFFTSKLHPDDYDRVMNNMIDHLKGVTHVYEVEYRILAKDGQYKWYYDRGSITKRDESGKPLLLAGIVFDITEKKLQELNMAEEKATLEIKAVTDELTGALNHRGIIEQLNESTKQASHINQPISVLMLDIDDFKLVNDTYGHLIGDSVLKDIVVLSKENLRQTDFIGRYGGEEFLVIFTNTSRKVAHEIANRIRKAIEQHHFTKDIKVTISGGVYEYPGGSLYDLIHQADINLYEAKRTGKNKIV